MVTDARRRTYIQMPSTSDENMRIASDRMYIRAIRSQYRASHTQIITSVSDHHIRPGTSAAAIKSHQLPRKAATQPTLPRRRRACRPGKQGRHHITRAHAGRRSKRAVTPPKRRTPSPHRLDRPLRAAIMSHQPRRRRAQPPSSHRTSAQSILGQGARSHLGEDRGLLLVVINLVDQAFVAKLLELAQLRFGRHHRRGGR